MKIFAKYASNFLIAETVTIEAIHEVGELRGTCVPDAGCVVALPRWPEIGATAQDRSNIEAGIRREIEAQAYMLDPD